MACNPASEGTQISKLPPLKGIPFLSAEAAPTEVKPYLSKYSHLLFLGPCYHSLGGHLPARKFVFIPKKKKRKSVLLTVHSGIAERAKDSPAQHENGQGILSVLLLMRM